MQLSIAFTCGLICLLAVSTAQPTPEEMEHMHKLMEKCVAESGVDPEVLKNSKKGEGADDEKLHCFGACMMKNMGVMNEAGEIQADKAIEMIPDHMPKEDTTRLIELCSKEKGSDACDTASLVFKCLHANNADEILHMHHD